MVGLSKAPTPKRRLNRQESTLNRAVELRMETYIQDRHPFLFLG